MLSETPNPPEVVTGEPDLTRAAALCVAAFQCTLPMTARARIQPPSPVNFERVKAAIVTEGGRWMVVRDGLVAITAKAVLRKADIGNIAYVLQTWENQAGQREVERYLAEAKAGPVDPRVQQVIESVTGKVAARLPDRDQNAPPPVSKETPDERMAREAWQAQRRKELEEENR